MNKLPKRVLEEIDILGSNYADASPHDYTLKSLIMSELRGYLRALEHTGLITKEEKSEILRSVK